MLVFLCLLLHPATSSLPDYYNLLGVQKSEQGVVDPTTLTAAFHEKIQPIFASGKVFTDRTKLQQFSLLYEAKRCLSELGCIDAYLKGVTVQGQDPFPRHEDETDGSWSGVHLLSPWEFRTQVLGGDGSVEWLVFFSASMDSKHVNQMRQALLDSQSILRHEKLRVGVVMCSQGEYDLCTALGKSMALVLWNSRTFFRGQMNYFALTKFLVTQLLPETKVNTYSPNEILPRLAVTKKALFLIDVSSSKDIVTLSDAMTVAKISEPFAEVGFIDCEKHKDVCGELNIPEAMEGHKIQAYYVGYNEYHAGLTTEEEMKSSLYGLAHRGCGDRPETILDVIVQDASHESQRLVQIEATPLHKMTIKVKHGRIPPFAVYMGPRLPGIRMFALNHELMGVKADPEKRLYHLSCDDLELYCYRFNADEDVPKIIVFKSGGFEMLYSRDSIYDKAKAVREALTGKLLTMRSEDLYAKLQDGPMENTMVQYMNSTRYTMYDMESALEKDVSLLRHGANIVHEVHGTTTYLVDCALHTEICEANKVVDSSGLHYIQPTKVIKQHTGFLKSHLYLAFVNEVSKKDEAVEDNLGENTPESVRNEFERFSDEL